MSDNRVSWIFLATLVIAAAWGIWLKLNEPEREEPEIQWVRVGGKLVERDTQEPYQGVRALPFEGAPGMVQWEYTYVDGVRQGAAIEYYPSPNKKVKSRSTYVDGKLEGLVIHYHSNGVVMSKSTAVAGLLDGLVTFYREDGTVRERSVYDRSAPAGVLAIVAEPVLEDEASSDDEDQGEEGEPAEMDETAETAETIWSTSCQVSSAENRRCQPIRSPRSIKAMSVGRSAAMRASMLSSRTFPQMPAST